jgi:hypothetical protein
VLVFQNREGGDGPIFLIRDDAQLMKTAQFALFERNKSGWYNRAGKGFKDRLALCLAGHPSPLSVELLFERSDKKYEGVRLVDVKEV